MRRSVGRFVVSLAVLVGVVVPVVPATAQAATVRRAAPDPTALPVPDRFTSVNGVLHLKVVAKDATSTINGERYTDMEIYDERVVGGEGRFRPGTSSTYVAPTWEVQPGDRIVIDYVNRLGPLSFTPVATGTAENIPQPLNLHFHGLRVNPSGNGDNVLLTIPPRRSNRYEVRVPRRQPRGLYWYHPHIHGITDQQVYNGLAGLLVVGRADGDYRQFDGLRVREMMIRYSVVQPGAGGDLVDASAFETTGTALPPRGTMIYTVNGIVAPSIRIEPAVPDASVPAESQVWAFTNITGSASYVLALEEVDAADARDPSVQGTPVPFTVVSVDGTPMPNPEVLSGDAAKRGYFIGQGGRVAVLVQGASAPGRVVRLMQVENRSGSGLKSAYDYPDQQWIGGWRDYTRTVLAVGAGRGSGRHRHVDTPAVLTTAGGRPADLSAAPVDYRRTFVFDGVAPPTVTSPNNFPVNGALFPDNRVDQPKVGTVEEWTLLNVSSLVHPFHFHTEDGQVMSVVSPASPDYVNPPGDYPTVQTVVDENQPTPADHGQDVVNIPPARLGPDGMPLLDASGKVVEPGKVVLRVAINDYLGTYVEHCHRLPHEDRGMMSLLRAIPHDPVAAVIDRGRVRVYRSSDWARVGTIPPPTGGRIVATAVGDVDGDTVPDVAVLSRTGGPDPETRVRVLSGATRYRGLIMTELPSGSVRWGSLAVGDLTSDGYDDVVVGAGRSSAGHVVVYGGAQHTRIADFVAGSSRFRGGVSVATGTVTDGGRVALLVGQGPGGRSQVRVYDPDLYGDARGHGSGLRNGRLRLRETARFDGLGVPDPRGVEVTTGYPFAAEGGFASILVTPRSGPATLHAYVLTGHAGGGDVAASGVFRPHLAAPGEHRMATEIGVTEVPGAATGASVGAVSTQSGAVVLLASPGGGRIRQWQADGTTLAPAADLPFRGVAVAGI